MHRMFQFQFLQNLVRSAIIAERAAARKAQFPSRLLLPRPRDKVPVVAHQAAGPTTAANAWSRQTLLSAFEAYPLRRASSTAGGNPAYTCKLSGAGESHPSALPEEYEGGRKFLLRS